MLIDLLTERFEVLLLNVVLILEWIIGLGVIVDLSTRVGTDLVVQLAVAVPRAL